MVHFLNQQETLLVCATALSLSVACVLLNSMICTFESHSIVTEHTNWSKKVTCHLCHNDVTSKDRIKIIP